jgi:predicted esterase
MMIVQVAHSSSAVGSYRIGEDRHPEIKPFQSLPQGGTFNMTFRSEIDGIIQPLLVGVPKSYTPAKSWPLLVTLHGFGDGPILAPGIETMVQIGPYGRGSVWYEGIGERDVFECIEIAKRLFSVDSERVYLCGFSMGGTGTFNLGFKHPDAWAACVPVCGRCDSLDLVSNARHLPFWINTGSRDIVIPPESSRAAFDKAKQLDFAQWKYTEHKTMGHDFSINFKDIEEWLLTQKRATNPSRLSFRTKDIRFNRAYYLEITEIERYGKIAQIDVDIEGQKIYVKSENVSNYTLKLNNALVDATQRVRIIENDVKIFDGFISSDGCFVKASGNNHVVSKRSGLSGPLWDIYSDFCLLVYGTHSKDKSVVRASRMCAESFSNPSWMSKVRSKIVPDKEVSKKDIAQNNVVLFGNPEMNEVLAGMSDTLPIKVKGNDVLVRDMKYSGDNIGFVLIYPNPMNRAKYIVVFSGFTVDTINCFDKIWPRFNSVLKDIDFGVFEIHPGEDAVRWCLKGIFGTDWNWQQ